jgi:hypothetical protein
MAQIPGTEELLNMDEQDIQDEDKTLRLSYPVYPVHPR